LQLHWADDNMNVDAVDFDRQPLLRNDPQPEWHRRSGGSGGSGGSAASGSDGSGGRGVEELRPRTSIFGWIRWGLRLIGNTFVSIICAFLFGGRNSSGLAFSRALVATYGITLPRFYEGSFQQALMSALRDLKLLVVYLHSDNSRYTREFCTSVLNNEFIRTMLDENFVLWGGDITRMEAHHVSQMVHARQYPCFCVLLPASVEEIRVVGSLHGEVRTEAAVGMLSACMEEMDVHRAEIVGRQAQHQEDRSLREQQDREYEEGLARDREREESQRTVLEQEREAQRIEEEQRRQELDALAKAEEEKREIQLRRQRAAAALAPAANATARLCVRLRSGQRVERKFAPTSKLSEVYAWADCLAYLPEHVSSNIEVPPRFVLKTSFPSRELTQMDSTVEELNLAGTIILLVEVEDD